MVIDKVVELCRDASLDLVSRSHFTYTILGLDLAGRPAAAAPSYTTVARLPLQTHTDWRAKRLSIAVERTVAAHTDAEFAGSVVNVNNVAANPAAGSNTSNAFRHSSADHCHPTCKHQWPPRPIQRPSTRSLAKPVFTPNCQLKGNPLSPSTSTASHSLPPALPPAPSSPVRTSTLSSPPSPSSTQREPNPFSACKYIQPGHRQIPVSALQNFMNCLSPLYVSHTRYNCVLVQTEVGSNLPLNTSSIVYIQYECSLSSLRYLYIQLHGYGLGWGFIKENNKVRKQENKNSNKKAIKKTRT